MSQRMFLYISYRDENTKDWHSASARELTRSIENELELFQVRGARVAMTNGEVLAVSAGYAPGNRSVSIHAALDGVQLVGVSGFKVEEAGFDPSVVFRTPRGMYVSVMLGPQHGADAPRRPEQE
jgi:hypothetical protein